MAAIDEALETIWPAIGFVNREQRDTVVPPALLTCPRGHRHHLNVRHSQIRKMPQMLDRSIECAFLAEGADVQFVDDGASLGGAPPKLIVPLEESVVIELRRTVHSIRLTQSTRVGIWRRI